MYDSYELTDNRLIDRQVWTDHYFLKPKDIEVDRKVKISKEYREKSLIFTNSNGTDLYYILPKSNPTIGNDAVIINTGRVKECCFDIVYISNGEKFAEENFERLMDLNLPNTIHRVDRVKGRNNAYKTAASVSTTRYFFAVFAKLEIDPLFDFSFGAEDFDYRHYVFHAKNPVNGLTYGHQAVILYNKDQVLANPGNQIDFTMAQMYREIPLLSGIARYNYSELAAWRASFRECLKLCMFTDAISKERLEIWQTGEGPFAHSSIQGAKDAIAFHKDFHNDPDMLYKSYDWEWLDNYFASR